MIFFHETAAFTHTMYFFGIRRFGIRRNGRTPSVSLSHSIIVRLTDGALPVASLWNSLVSCSHPFRQIAVDGSELST